MSTPARLNVAIVGGGLCGLSLAIALRNQSLISYTIYEARASFTEIGAGINLGPNTLKAFELIDKSLGDAVSRLCTRNPPGQENVWMQIRLGAPAQSFKDAEVVTDLMAPPTGNSTVRRNDLLALLAERAGAEHARFNKKLVALQENDSQVTLRFSDGTEATADAVIACDGIHSTVRRILLGDENPASVPHFTECGAYRAILSREKLEEAVGADIARTSNAFVGPGGYIIMYPVEGLKSVNVGFWPIVAGPWVEKEWVVPAQKQAMEKDFAKWGETVHKIMRLMGDPPFYATHHHKIQPDSCFGGRVCLIGDAAHSMPPHQGAGAGQAMEDAFVLAEALDEVEPELPMRAQIEAAFEGYQTVRQPHSQRVLETSVDAMTLWAKWYKQDLTEQDFQDFNSRMEDRMHRIWYNDIAGQAEDARTIMQSSIKW